MTLLDEQGDDGGGDRHDHGDSRRQWVAILDGRTVVPVSDPMRWAQWFETADRRVALTQLGRRLWVSTVFVGISMGVLDGDQPQWFETATFQGGPDHPTCDVQWRTSTWEEAETYHALAVSWARATTDAWTDRDRTGRPCPLRRVRFMAIHPRWPAVMDLDNGEWLDCGHVYRTRRRVPYRASTLRRRLLRFGDHP